MRIAHTHTSWKIHLKNDTDAIASKTAHRTRRGRILRSSSIQKKKEKIRRKWRKKNDKFNSWCDCYRCRHWKVTMIHPIVGRGKNNVFKSVDKIETIQLMDTYACNFTLYIVHICITLTPFDRAKAKEKKKKKTQRDPFRLWNHIILSEISHNSAHSVVFNKNKNKKIKTLNKQRLLFPIAPVNQSETETKRHEKIHISRFFFSSFSSLSVVCSLCWIELNWIGGYVSSKVTQVNQLYGSVVRVKSVPFKILFHFASFRSVSFSNTQYLCDYVYSKIVACS